MDNENNQNKTVIGQPTKMDDMITKIAGTGLGAIAGTTIATVPIDIMAGAAGSIPAIGGIVGGALSATGLVAGFAGAGAGAYIAWKSIDRKLEGDEKPFWKIMKEEAHGAYQAVKSALPGIKTNIQTIFDMRQDSPTQSVEPPKPKM